MYYSDMFTLNEMWSEQISIDINLLQNIYIWKTPEIYIYLFKE